MPIWSAGRPVERNKLITRRSHFVHMPSTDAPYGASAVGPRPGGNADQEPDERDRLASPCPSSCPPSRPPHPCDPGPRGRRRASRPDRRGRARIGGAHRSQPRQVQAGRSLRPARADADGGARRQPARAGGLGRSPTTGTPTRCSSSATAAPRSSRSTKTGQLIDSMTLAAGGSPQGTTFYDTEGITYIGDGEFVMTEERDRQLVRFTYVAGTTLTRADAQTVKLGTTIGNIGLEGVTNDPRQRRLHRRQGERAREHLPDRHRLGRRHRDQRLADDRRVDQPLRPGARRPARLLRRLRALEPDDADRPRREPPADHQPGVGQDRQRRPRGQRLELADDRRRPRQPAVGPRPDATRA